jgi:DNA-binding NtrC family response regulator
MITGMEEAFEGIAREAVRRTAYAFLKKPLDMNQVLSLLQKITGQRASDALKKPEDGS